MADDFPTIQDKLDRIESIDAEIQELKEARAKLSSALADQLKDALPEGMTLTAAGASGSRATKSAAPSEEGPKVSEQEIFDVLKKNPMHKGAVATKLTELRNEEVKFSHGNFAAAWDALKSAQRIVPTGEGHGRGALYKAA